MLTFSSVLHWNVKPPYWQNNKQYFKNNFLEMENISQIKRASWIWREFVQSHLWHAAGAQLSAKLELLKRIGKLQATWQVNSGNFFCCRGLLDVLLGSPGWGKNISQSLLRIKWNMNFLREWYLAEWKPGRDHAGN